MKYQIKLTTFVIVAAVTLAVAIIPRDSAEAVRLTYDMPDTANVQDLEVLDADYPVIYGNRVTAFAVTNSGIRYFYGSEGGITDQISISNRAGFYRTGDQGYGGLNNAVSLSSIAVQHVFFSTASDPSVSLRLERVDLGIKEVGTRSAGSFFRVEVSTNNGLNIIWAKDSVVFGTNSFSTTFDFTGPDNTARILPLLKGESRLYFTVQNPLINPGNTWAFDNLQFSQVPEPSALGLLSVAGALLALRRRRLAD